MRNIKINENLEMVIRSITLTIVFVIGLQLIILGLKKAGVSILSDSLIGNVLLESVILSVQCIIIKKYTSTNIFKELGLYNNKNCLINLFTGIGAGFICCILMYVSIFLMKIGFYEGSGFEIYSFNLVIISIFSVLIRAVFASVCEEVFFRGVLLNYLNKYRGKLFGITVSSLIFALPHITRYSNLNEILSVLIMGIVLGYIYIETKSLYMPIGLHFATDFFTSIVGTESEAGLFILGINSRFGSAGLSRSILIISSFLYLILLVTFALVNKRKKSSEIV
jgi:Predicted metal-dependent membrane protease